MEKLFHFDTGPFAGQSPGQILRILFDASTTAIAAARREKDKIGGAVNWANLRVLEARIGFERYSQLGDLYQFLEIGIVKADSDAVEFCEWIRKWLQEHGYGDVQVKTEW